MEPRRGDTPARAIQQDCDSGAEENSFAEAALHFRVFEHEQRYYPEDLHNRQSKEVTNHQLPILAQQSDDPEGDVQTNRRKETHHEGRLIGRGRGFH
jgi:hypothetical protein